MNARLRRLAACCLCCWLASSVVSWAQESHLDNPGEVPKFVRDPIPLYTYSMATKMSAPELSRTTYQNNLSVGLVVPFADSPFEECAVTVNINPDVNKGDCCRGPAATPVREHTGRLDSEDALGCLQPWWRGLRGYAPSYRTLQDTRGRWWHTTWIRPQWSALRERQETRAFQPARGCSRPCRPLRPVRLSSENPVD